MLLRKPEGRDWAFGSDDDLGGTTTGLRAADFAEVPEETERVPESPALPRA